MKTDQSASKFLKYGDFITLLGTTSNLKHGSSQGFLSCMGFSDTRVFYQTIPNVAMDAAMKQAFSLSGKAQSGILVLELFVDHSVNALSFIKNYDDFVFQVWPRLNFEAHKDYRKCLKEKERLNLKMTKRQNKTVLSVPQSALIQDSSDVILQQLHKQITSPVKTNKSAVVPETPVASTEMDLNALIESLDNKLKILTERIEQERILNDQQLEHFMGDNVTYGATLQLLHFDSRMFLNGKIVASEAEKSAYKFELSNSYSGGMMFRFSPKFKLRQLGEPIQFNDMLIIHNIKLNCYINFAMEIPIEIDRKANNQNPEPILPITDVRLNDERTPRYETFMTLFSDTCWQVLKHGKGVREQNDSFNLRGGEIVRLRHTELNELLTADMAYIGDLPEVFLRWYLGTFPEEIISLGSLWQLEIDIPFHRGAHLHYQTKGDDTPYFFRVRHILTGRLMGVADITVAGVKKQTLVLLKDEDIKQNSAYDLATRVIFLPTMKTETNNLRGGGCYHMQIGGRFLRFMVHPEYISGKQADPYFSYKVKKPVSIPKFFQQLNEKELQISRKGVEFADKKTEEDAFWVEAISDELKNEIKYIQSTLPHILRFVQFIRDKQLSLLTTEYLRHILKIMKQLMFFITGTLEDSDKPNDFPVQSRQRMFRNCYLVDYLTMILHFSFQNQLVIPGEFVNAPKDMLVVLRTCYQLIKVTIKEYRPNELYMSQWIEMLMDQAMIKDPYYDIEAGSTLTELIDNNRFVLENKINPQTIDRFVEELLSTKDVKYVQLLQALINCDGEAMVGTQSEISKRILTKESQKILIPQTNFDGQSVMYYYNGEWIGLNELSTYSNQETFNTGAEFTYYVILIEFLGDLCLDKNFLAIEPLQEVFPLEMCKFIIKDHLCPSQLRRSFTRLTISLWVDGKQLQKLQIPNCVRTWEDIASEKPVDILSSRNDTSMFNDLKDFINIHLQSEVDKGFQRSFQTDGNSFTYTILQLADLFLTYGFYKDQAELKVFCGPLIGYLNSCNDVTTKEEERAKNSELNNLKQNRVDMRRMSRAANKQGKMSFKTRYQDTEETQLLAKSRSLVCKILLFVNQLTNDVRSTYFLKEFKKFQEAAEVEPVKPPTPKNSNFLSAGFKSIGAGFKSLGNLIPIKLDDLNIFKMFQSEQENNPDLVPLKWINQILELHELDILNERKEELVAILMDLIMYENVDLISSAFLLLNDTYSHKIALVHYLKNIQLIDQADKMKLLQEVQDANKQMQVKVDQSENWWNMNDQKSLTQNQSLLQLVDRLKAIMFKGAENEGQGNKFKLQPINKRSGDLMLSSPRNQKESIEQYQFLVFIGSHDQSMVNEEDDLLLQRAEQSDQVQEHPEFQLGIVESFMQAHIKPEFQKMMRNLEIYKPLLQLINFDMQVTSQKQPQPESTLLMRSIYQFLAAFVYNNPKNKELLRQHVKLFRGHLAKNKNMLAHLVLQEIFRDNRVVLNNQKKLKKVIVGVCDIMEQLDRTDPLIIFLLESLCIYMRIDGRVIKQNQILVLNCFGTRTKLLSLLDNPAEQTAFFLKVAELSKQFDQVLFDQHPQPGGPEIKIPFEINYFSVFLKVMATAAENKNNAAESRCQAYFPMKKIHHLLLNTKKCWPLRKAIAQFYFDVFIDIEKELKDNEDHNPLIVQELVEDLVFISDHGSEIQESQVHLLTFSEVVQGKRVLFDYLNETLFPILQLTVQGNLLNSQRNLKQVFSKVVNAVYKLSNIGSNRINDNAALLLNLIEDNFRITKELSYITQFKPNAPTVLTNLLRKLEGTVIIITKAKQTTQSRVQLLEQNLNGIYSEKLDKLTKHEVFNKAVEFEIEEMVEHILKIDRLTSRKLRTTTITFDQIAAQMIRLVDPRSDPLPPYLCMVGLKIFRKIIEKENPGQIRPAADWKPSDYSLYEKKIQEKQNELVRLGLVDVICAIIKMDGSAELKNEAVLVGIAMLLSGNTRTQNMFYEFFQKDSKNMFMIALKVLADSNYDLIKKFCDQKIRDRELEIKNQQIALKQQKMQQQLEAQQKQGVSQPQSENVSQTGVNSVEPPQQAAQTGGDPFHQSDQYEFKLMLDLQRLYRFMQLLCEGHNLKMQNYLRAQVQQDVTNGKTINFINYASIKFGILLKSLCVENIDLHHRMMDFMIESIQGPCEENQQALGGSKIVDFCNELIMLFTSEQEYKKRGFTTPEARDQADELVSKATRTLLSLIEGNTTPENALHLSTTVELHFLQRRLIQIYFEFVTNELKIPVTSALHVVNARAYETIDNFEGPIGGAFDIFVLIISLADKLKVLEDQNDNYPQALLQEVLGDESEQIAMEFYRTNTASVEINFQGKLVRVFFPIAPTCRNLSKLTRVQFMEEVDRGSPNEKIAGLISVSSIMFTEMHHMSLLRRLPFQFTSVRLEYLKSLSTLVALIINLVMIASMKREVESNQSFIVNGELFGVVDASIIITILGLIQLVTSSLMLTFWIIINIPCILKSQWNNFIEEHKQELTTRLELGIYEVNRDPTKYTTEEISYLFRTKGPESIFFRLVDEQYFGSLFAKILYYIKSFIFLCSDPNFLYMFFYIIVSIVAVSQSEILYCFHLLDFVNRSDTLKNVVRSVTQNGNQLFLTLVLMCFMMYVYALILYTYFENNLYHADIQENECVSVFECFLNTMQFGLRNGGGMADSFRMLSFNENYYEAYWIRVLYDLSFFAIITTISLNILIGIIIDTFAELRDEKNEKYDDMSNKCYICGLDKYIFEKNSDGFKNHIERDHQLYNYLHYIHYLENKDATEHDGVESHCVEMLEKGDIEWFPIMKAISLSSMDQEEGIAEKLNGPILEIQTSMLEIKKQLDSIKLDQKPPAKPITKAEKQ